MKFIHLFILALLLATFASSASSHDVSLSIDDKNVEQLQVIKFGYIWVAQVKKESIMIDSEAGDAADAADSTFEHRGVHYRFIGSEIINNQDILNISAHSPSSLSIELTPQGENKLATATAENIGKQMAVLINDEVVNIATVQMKLGAKMVITGLNEEQINYMLSRESK